MARHTAHEGGLTPDVERVVLGNLLAVIHRDGGQYAELHGEQKAAEDAEAIVLALRSALEEAFDLYNLGMSAGHDLGPAPGDNRETKRIKTKMREALDAYEALPTSPVAGAPQHEN